MNYHHKRAMRRHGACDCSNCDGDGVLVVGRNDWSAREIECPRCVDGLIYRDMTTNYRAVGRRPMSIREKQNVLAARLADVEGEIAEYEAQPTIDRDVDQLMRLYVQRTAIKRDMNSKHGSRHAA